VNVYVHGFPCDPSPVGLIPAPPFGNAAGGSTLLVIVTSAHIADATHKMNRNIKHATTQRFDSFNLMLSTSSSMHYKAPTPQPQVADHFIPSAFATSAAVE
jgi:hypothetical protein